MNLAKLLASLPEGVAPRSTSSNILLPDITLIATSLAVVLPETTLPAAVWNLWLGIAWTKFLAPSLITPLNTAAEVLPMFLSEAFPFTISLIAIPGDFINALPGAIITWVGPSNTPVTT